MTNPSEQTDAGCFCRICGSSSVKKICTITPYQEYEFPVLDCENCGCRFVWRKTSVHDQLHRCSESPYSGHSSMGAEIELLFKQHNPGKIRQLLSKTCKFRFILDELDSAPQSAKILEIGSSQGYLTAYFILSGYDITGSDVSEFAVSKSNERFGNHFIVLDAADSALINQLGCYDVIFLLGTIGCVEDPIKVINNLLRILNPDGKLLFNSPDLQSVIDSHKIWVDTPPPDLITIFPDTFWKKFFSETAEVTLSFEPYDHPMNIQSFFSKVIKSENGHPEIPSIWECRTKQSGYRKIIPGIFHISILLLSPFLKYVTPRRRLEYGQFICMRKK